MFNHYNTLTARKYRVHDLSLGPDRPTYEFRPKIHVNVANDKISIIQEVIAIVDSDDMKWRMDESYELRVYLLKTKTIDDMWARLDEYFKHNGPKPE